MASLHTALDAFIAPFPGRNPAGGLRRANRLSCRFVSLVFLRLTGTCSLRPSLGATLRAAVAVQIVCPADLSLNHSHRYAFGPRIKYGAGSGTRQPQKSSAIFASIGEICGLGEGIARHLAESGSAGLVICGRNQEQGKKVAAIPEEIGTPTLYVCAGLSQDADCSQVVQACDERYGRVDGLVNAAGVTTRGTLEDTTVELWDYIFAVNSRAPFILMQESVRLMKRDGRGSSIVNILSMSSYGGQPFIIAYCSSKGALATLTKNATNALRFEEPHGRHA